MFTVNRQPGRRIRFRQISCPRTSKNHADDFHHIQVDATTSVGQRQLVSTVINQTMVRVVVPVSSHHLGSNRSPGLQATAGKSSSG